MVIALADQVRRHLQRGVYRGLGPVDLPPDGLPLEAETAALVVLADVEHHDWEDRAGVTVPQAVWRGLAVQLRFLEDAAMRADAGDHPPGG
jgi:hypothetical protein